MRKEYKLISTKDPLCLPDALQSRAELDARLKSYILCQAQWMDEKDPIKDLIDAARQGDVGSFNQLVSLVLSHRSMDYNSAHFDDPIVGRDLGSLLNEPTMICPSVSLETEYPLVDLTCCVVQSIQAVILIVEIRESLDAPEGIGKTQALLDLVGVSPYRTALPSDLTGVYKLDQFEFQKTDRTGFRIIASDMAFLTSYCGELVLIPALGERAIAVWDVARHLFRLIDPAYFSGKQRTPEGRESLKLILLRIPYLILADRFADTLAFYEPTAIMILCRARQDHQRGPVLRKLNGEEGVHLLQRAMENPIYHRSPFWSRDNQMHRRYVQEILSGLESIPTILRMDIGKAVHIAEAVRHVADSLKRRQSI